MFFLHITRNPFRLQIKNKSTQNNSRLLKHENDVIWFRYDGEKALYINEKKNIEDSIKDGLSTTATTTGIFFALKAANVKPRKASLDTMDIIKLAGGIC